MGLSGPYKYRHARMDYCPCRFSSVLTKSSLAGPGWCRAATNAPLTASDGMYHQDFILLARDFLDAFTGSHVKWLRTGLGFIFGNYVVHFLHIGSCRIVFEKRRIATG